MNQQKKAYQKAYRAAHREEKKAYQKVYRATHREEKRARDAAYRARGESEKRKASRKAYRAAHREERKAYNAAHREEREIRRIARKYNVSLRDAELLVTLRDGEGSWCDICHTTEARFHIDHDHNTGKIRGILCGKHNRFLGNLENASLMQAVRDYLASGGAQA